MSLLLEPERDHEVLQLADDNRQVSAIYKDLHLPVALFIVPNAGCAEKAFQLLRRREPGIPPLDPAEPVSGVST